MMHKWSELDISASRNPQNGGDFWDMGPLENAASTIKKNVMHL